MAYTKTTWQNLPNTTTPITAANLNNIEDGIETLDNAQITVNNSYNTSTTDTYSCNYVNTLNTFSTNEIRIGTWIDGKPLYEKTIQMNTVSSSTTGTYNISSLNISNVWIDFGKSFYKSGALSLPLNRTHTGSTNSQSEARVSPTTISLICGSAITAENPVITINYTKTTD